LRKACIDVITELAEKDKRIMILTSDLGYLLMESFAQKFPNQYINIGVAEQNMVGISTGLAEAGMIPFIYSIIPFAVLRPYEFIRNGPIYHQLRVRIIGVGGGFEYPHDGISHFGIDDIGVLRVQPGLSIFTPADYKQANTIIKKTWNLPGPIYYRLGKDEQTEIPGLDGEFEVGSAQIIGNGKDLLIISMGSIAREASDAIKTLESKGVFCTLMVVSSINPPPLSKLAETLPNFHQVMTVEAHYINGGLGSLVSEFAAEGNFDCTITRCGVKSVPNGQAGSLEYIHDQYNISRDALVRIAIGLHQKSGLTSQD
jgi:transketolase